ncbi:methionine ABC transporter permease [Actinoplanes xinjiangensis]|jgi:D-methionine transport system permease protein|uniref:D-methionine transport system permease protein n=1 Tax=Actinoplanes xinjiangensis TaxID=512350 RepID=A0A316FUW7_9ACTN|nr:methionine ABC transporter permease [Actinoplanes xinjiangensis]PWK52531.1 D-methionine transport system permease protein [Actinoplanes xinjiangensis]GIF36771.1 ABC transporter permease [Actinoplanes xinjiangensis]
MTWSEVFELLTGGLRETAWMVGVSALLTAVGGLLLGVLLVLTDKGRLRPVNVVLGAIVNVGRSLPFIILLVAVIPFTRAIVGTTIGTDAAIVPLTIGAIPFFARIVESALREVPPDVVAAATAMGATRRQIVGKVLLREALPGLVAGLTITVIALVGYSAMAGVVGGGGLGDLAIRYGYQRFETEVMIATVIALVVFVQLVQMVGDLLVRRLSHR